MYLKILVNIIVTSSFSFSVLSFGMPSLFLGAVAKRFPGIIALLYAENLGADSSTANSVKGIQISYFSPFYEAISHLL